ncbi:MAG: site-2 protease family protein [Alphaproteobacteria bacterium]
MTGFLLTASVWVLPVLFAITMHEAAHGWVAWQLGDDTAKRLGRVTFNPLAHIDRFGTILLPATLLFIGAPFLFGWAKPVPVNFGRLRRPRRDMILVAAAGPGINIVLAIVSAAALHLAFLAPDPANEWLQRNLINSLQINVILAVFNMLPIPPLDGGRVLVGLLPAPLAWRVAKLERVGMFILIALIFILPLLGQQFGVRLDIFSWLVGTPAFRLMQLIATGVGLG